MRGRGCLLTGFPKSDFEDEGVEGQRRVDHQNQVTEPALCNGTDVIALGAHMDHQNSSVTKQ